MKYVYFFPFVLATFLEASESLTDGNIAEWIALVGLALAGFALIFRSNYQLKKIEKLQKELGDYQNKVQYDLNHMEQNHD